MSPSTSPSEFARLKQALPRAKQLLGIGLDPTPVRAASFYLAIGLPFVYLPMIAGGLSIENVPMVTALLAANALTLVLGHRYGEDDSE
jgi:hypothetical protein